MSGNDKSRPESWFCHMIYGWNGYFILILEFTTREVLDQCARSAVPGENRGEKLPRPAYVPHLHPAGAAAPAIRLFALIGIRLIVAMSVHCR